MEHAAAIDVPGMEAAGISLEEFVYYHCRVSADRGWIGLEAAGMHQQCSFAGDVCAVSFCLTQCCIPCRQWSTWSIVSILRLQKSVVIL